MIYKAGDILSHTITVTNNGALVATNVIVEVTKPSGLVYDSCTPSDGAFPCTGAVTQDWTITSLSPGQSETLALDLEVTDVCDAPYTLTWAATADQPDNILTNNSGSYLWPEDSCCEVKDCAVKVTKQVWVDFTYGDDDSAALENPQKPYALIQTALDSINSSGDTTFWTMHIIGATGNHILSGLPEQFVMQFYNNDCSDFTFTDGYGPTLRGRVNLGTNDYFYTPLGALNTPIVLDNFIMVSAGTSPILDTDAVEYINIGSSTNYTGGFSNVTFSNEPLNIIPNLA